MSLRVFRRSLVLLLVLALYLVSFHEPAIYFRQVANGIDLIQHPAGHVIKTGKDMAFGSLFGPLFGNFAILANPLLIIGCILIAFRKAGAAIVCLALAMLFALQTFQMMVIPYHEDEGGVMLSYMLHPLVGWYCWFGAILLAFILAVEQKLTARQELTAD